MAALLPRLWGSIDDMFDREFPGAHLIRIEESVTDDEYVLRAELPGVDPDKEVSVSVDNGMLTIEAERTVEEKDKKHSEFRYGSLRRSVGLPANAVPDKVNAMYHKGILEVTVPLSAKESTGHRIPITVK